LAVVGTGVIEVTVANINRADWDAFLIAVAAFQVAHPQITRVITNYTERS
jgi:hypothetical protein